MDNCDSEEEHTPNPLAKSTYRIGDFVLMETLGTGTFSKVKVAVHIGTKCFYACKIQTKRKTIKENSDYRNIQNEIESMRRLSHRNIVSVHKVLTTSTKIYIFMDLVDGGALVDKVQHYNGLTEAYSRYIFRQILDAVQYCHTNGIYHRDLKMDNILLSSDGTIKVADFGLSSLGGGCNPITGSTTASKGATSQCGTPHYIPPEMITLGNNSYSAARIDYWACGILLFILSCGSFPFDSETLETKDGRYSLFSKIVCETPSFPSYFSKDLKDLIEKILMKDPKKRMTIVSMRQHPWFNGPVEEHMSDERPVFSGAGNEVPKAQAGGASASPTSPLNEEPQPECVDSRAERRSVSGPGSCTDNAKLTPTPSPATSIKNADQVFASSGAVTQSREGGPVAGAGGAGSSQVGGAAVSRDSHAAPSLAVDSLDNRLALMLNRIVRVSEEMGAQDSSSAASQSEYETTSDSSRESHGLAKESSESSSDGDYHSSDEPDGYVNSPRSRTHRDRGNPYGWTDDDDAKEGASLHRNDTTT